MVKFEAPSRDDLVITSPGDFISPPYTRGEDYGLFHLRDQDLLIHFLEALANQDQNKTVDETMRAMVGEERNVYRKLRRLLIPVENRREADALLRIEEIPDTLRLPQSLPAAGVERAIVWGGTYSAAESARIRSDVAIDLDFYDWRTLASQAAHFRGGELVLWIASGSDHPAFWRVKREYDQRGSQFVSFPHKGIEMLTNFLKQVVAQGSGERHPG